MVDSNPTYNSLIVRKGSADKWGVYIATPCTGLVRMEWVVARHGQVIPCNWGFKQSINWMPSCTPLGFLVADAQNVAVKSFLDSDSAWLFFIEQDNVLPADCFLRMNDWMRKKTWPVVAGLYFTKSVPAEPLVYRGRGNSYFDDWKMGDRVPVDAVPMGCTIIHRSLLETMWRASEPYMAGVVETRRVFIQPESSWHDPELGWHAATGTTDMEWCSRVMVENVLEKSGWKKTAKKPYPFLVDTQILTGHIDENGVNYPIGGVPSQFQPRKSQKSEKPEKPEKPKMKKAATSGSASRTRSRSTKG